MLYICGTPIGNLEDITIRQLNTLKKVDLIAAEDTRHTRKLLTHFEIKTPLTSYHEYNKTSKTDYLLKELLEGKDIALVTDSGMPIISDPGLEIVKACHENNIAVTTVPGPTAFVSGYILSGMGTESFVFEGFLTKKQKKQLDHLANEERTIILYESPHKLLKTLKLLVGVLGADRKIATVREITKLYEEVRHFNLDEAVKYYEMNAPMGEFVLVIKGKESVVEKDDTPLEIQVQNLIESGVSKNEAIKLVAKKMDLPKREVYAKVNIDEKQDE